ncbi:hypothetical protein M6B38_115445 [Iris pallida]|uniref:Uncharacterized protein n=1 Tax=Iris pallida TaxID=29817 RepID=A0AAX6I3R0_IRIPA|nr:hypothetical protein M6B38_115445 [Iris pallida]
MLGDLAVSRGTWSWMRLDRYIGWGEHYLTYGLLCTFLITCALRRRRRLQVPSDVIQSVMDVAPCTWCPLTLPERYGRRPLVPYMGTMPILFTARAHALKVCSYCINTLDG